jgi:hypothetical protein
MIIYRYLQLCHILVKDIRYNHDSLFRHIYIYVVI